MTFSQEKERILSFSKRGNAVSKTKAPIKKPKHFPILFGNNRLQFSFRWDTFLLRKIR
jgi:hypothetical protein